MRYINLHIIWKQYVFWIALVLCVGFLAGICISTAGAETGVVTGEVVNVRSGPGSNNSIVGTVLKDTQVDILESSGEWYKINYNKQSGWVSKTLINIKQDEIQVRVKEDTVNLRSGPDTTFPLAGQASKGTVFTLLDVQGQWYKIKTAEGKVAYIYSSLVEDTKNDVPAVTTAPASSVRKIQVIDGPVNVRSGPGTTYDKINTIADEAIFIIYAEKDGWFQIKLEDGTTAYVAGWLVKEISNENQGTDGNAVPAIAAAPTIPAVITSESGSNPPSVILDGKELKFEIAPIIENGRTMVPLRAIFEAIGAKVEWNNTTRTVTAVKGNTNVILPLNSTAPTVNGTIYSLEVPAKIVQDRTLAPLRFVGEAFGGKVNWDNNSRTITIISQSTSTGTKLTEVTVSGSEVSLRSGPAASYSKIDSARSGERLMVIGEKDGWYQVSRGERTAWIAGWLVQTTASNQNQPESQETASSPVASQPAQQGTMVPVDPNDLNTRGDEGVVVEAGFLSLSTRLAPEGYRLAMKSGGKSNPTITTHDNGKKIIYTYKGLKIKSGRDEAAFYIGNGQNTRVAISAETVDETTWVTINMPYPYHYLSNSEENGSKQVFLIPSQIKDVDEILLKNGNQIVVLRSTSGMQYREEYKNGLLTVTLPGTYRGLSLDNYELEGSIARQVQVDGSPEDNSTVIKIQLNQELETYQLTRNMNGDMISIILVPKNKKVEPTQEEKKVTLVLDPGHGGRDTGAARTLKEKDINLSIALKAKALLENDKIKIVMTRTEDKELGPDTKTDLQARADIANNCSADLFISIHCNSFTTTEAHGTGTYYYAPADNQKLAAQEYQRSMLADILQKALVEKLGRTDRGTRQDNFAVLRETNMTSVLMETAFISNPEEEALLGQDSFQQKAAEAIAQAVKRYITLMM